MHTQGGRQQADLVLDGGGVKGVALVGAVRVLAGAGYDFQRIAGTSAGAMVASVVAAMAKAGEPLDRLVDILRTVDYSRFTDRGPVGGFLARLGLSAVVDATSVLFHDGIYEGKYLLDWLRGTLADLGVRTFGDLRLPDDPGGDLPEGHRYRLVVVVSDVSRHRMLRLPWDYPSYGLPADDQPVADAVRASASIPFFFRPVTMKGVRRGSSTLVDGGMLSSFPITTFDRTDGRPPRWPTLGVRLVAREPAVPASAPVKGPLSLALAAVETMVNARDTLHLAEPCNQTRTTFVDTDAISGTKFDLDEREQAWLLDAGEQAAQGFLEGWDFEKYVRHCRGGAQ